MSLKVGLFSTTSINNIDLEIKSSLATTSLHGNVAFINQHPTNCHLGDRPGSSTIEHSMLSNRSKALQESDKVVTDVVSCHLPNGTYHISNSYKQLWLDNQNNSFWILFHSQVKIPKLPQHQNVSVVLPL